MKKRIVSGIQPSGNLHIGNYLGAIRQWIGLQDEFDMIAMVVDMHAITVPQKPEDLRRRTVEIAKIYLAAGLDPSKVAIFAQSHVPEHTELCWILNTITKNGDLTKMTQFKDKSDVDFDEIGKEFSEIQADWMKSLQNWKERFNSVGVGLFDYPVLMAGDILMYDAELVPVGEDQVQHIELTRTLGRRFNKKFGDTFRIPQPLLQKEGARIMALDNPQKKMSKSATSEYNYIALNDTPEQARKKIMKAVTDSGSEIVYQDDPPAGEAGKPALKNLINIYSLLSGKTTAEIEQMYVGKGYADFKRGLADVVAEFLTDFQGKFNAISDEDVVKVLREGAEKVRPLAQKKMLEVKQKVGFLA
jgi:tryptophanyl-tRNA synthetase